jgi:hypothetical protein
VDIYDSDYRRQYSRERIARIRDEYERVQAPPSDSQRPNRVAAWIRERVRREVPQRAPAYRS